MRFKKQIIKNAQRKAFNDEYTALLKGKQLPLSSKLVKLCPKLDKGGLDQIGDCNMLNFFHVM